MSAGPPLVLGEDVKNCHLRDGFNASLSAWEIASWGSRSNSRRRLIVTRGETLSSRENRPLYSGHVPSSA